MAWNEPGKGQDPWGGGNKNKGDGPPDLDQIWQKLRARFAKNGGDGGGNGSGGGGVGGPSPALLLLLVPVVLVIWLATGLYVVQPGEKGVVLRFGDYETTQDPGWHWRIPYPVDRVYKVDTQQVRRAGNRAVMLTKDENIVEVEVAAQYRISDAMNYLFQLRNPDQTVEQVLRSAVREIVGTSRMNQVIQEGVQLDELETQALEEMDLQEETQQPVSEENPMEGVDDALVDEIKAQQADYPEIGTRSRAMLPENIEKIVQTALSNYDAGINIIAVNVQYSQPPEQVQSAFEEAIRAREEEERKKNIAQAYAREVVARAEGEKAQILLEAEGYRERAINRSRGEASRFSAILAEYEQAPEVTRERLYLETMGEVISGVNLILAEQNEGGGGPLMYLPVDQMMQNARRNRQAEQAANQGPNTGGGDSSSSSSSSSNNASNDGRGGSTSSNNLRSRDRNS